MKKRETHIVKGMSRDLAVHRFDPNLVVDARNIRITTVKENSTLLSVTNEKGTSEFALSGDDIAGTIIGNAVLNNILVLFTTQDGVDRIYKLVFSSDYTSAVSHKLFEGTENNSLDFDAQHPLETLPIYENEDIQKVYWVDGKNQPRVINVAKNTPITNGDLFNFNREIKPDYSMEVVKIDSGGQFPAGTIQYCFNYFNKFGQETNIVETSPMYYLCPKDKGLPADAISTASFLIKLSGLDGAYDYVRLYSIIRTSENAVPNVRIVGDYRISNIKVLADWEIDNELMSFVFEDAYVINLNTGEKVYALRDEFTPPAMDSSLDIPLLAEQAIYIESTGDIFAKFYRSGDKGSKITIWYDERGFHAIRNSSSVIIKKTHFVGSAVESVSVVDTGLLGSTIDAASLLFIGGQDIIAKTITHKDNTLFLGNIKNKVPNIGMLELSDSGSQHIDIATAARGKASPCVFNAEGEEIPVGPDVRLHPEEVSDSAFYNYPYNNNKSSYDTKSFKAREGYRLGFIAQYKTGQWSEVVWIDDLDETHTPSLTMFYYVPPTGGTGRLSERGWGAYYKKPGFKAQLPASVVNTLLEAGFIRIAPVVCYPQEADRKVPFQGLLASTVYNVFDRNTNSPYVQADWRFRLGYEDTRIDGEIQCNTYGAAPHYPVMAQGETVQSAEWFVENYGNQYYRDSSILTFHSPDIDCNDEISQADLLDLKMRIVGVSTLSFIKNENDNYVNQRPERTLATFLFTSTQGFNAQATKLPLNYFADRKLKLAANPRGNGFLSQEDTYYDYYSDLAYVGFRDNALVEALTDASDIGLKAGDIRPLVSTNIYDWVTYLWHRAGSLNNQGALSEKAVSVGSKRYALLDKKCISEIQYARTTFFQDTNSFGPESIDVDINQPVLFDSDGLGVSKIALGNNTGLLYYGNIDKVITPTFPDSDIVGENYSCPVDDSPVTTLWSRGYPIEHCTMHSIVTGTSGRRNMQTGVSRTSYVPRNYSGGTEVYPDAFFGKDPVYMKYKSTKHAVIGINNVVDDQDRAISYLGHQHATQYEAFWENNEQIERRDILDNAFDAYATQNGASFYGVRDCVYVAELYREFSEERSLARFGGTAKSAISNNVWNRCGESVKLIGDEEATIYFKEGDTYLGRYDCLKTYPFTNEDQNQIVSIYSTEVESRVNLDARYDKNKGLTDNTLVNPTNFNLFNRPGYEQRNQYFTYKTIDYDRYNSLVHPNMLTWSLEKRMGADIDAWTSITMMSTADMQGDLGEINALSSFNDSIYAFQNRGIAQVLFNERVQVPTSDGQPIEITNGLKYGGLRYITNQIGLTNKWSLCKTPNGMYFVDDEKNTLYTFNGQQLQDLSAKQGMRTWFAAIDSHDTWNPSDYHNIRTFYDKVNGDVYFMTKEESLVFSEQVGAFISFMDYAGLPALVNMNDKFLTFVKNPVTKLNRTWELFAGDFNNFFGTFKPYWITFISNSDPTVDKIFDNLAWRTFDYSNMTNDFQGVLQPLQTFDHLRVWNDHQDSGEVALYDQEGRMTPILKKKFNVFRTLVPRDKLGNWRGKGFNRIRNTWSYIRLARFNPNEDLLMFSDLDVDFFE